MKLFSRKNEKIVRVKIINDTLSFSTRIEATRNLPAKNEVEPLDYEFGLKVAAVIGLVVNSMLAIRAAFTY
jgi:hypothetical protein